VFAYGIILHEIVTQKHPFEEFGFKMLYMLEEAVQKGVRPTLPKDCPQQLAKLIQGTFPLLLRKREYPDGLCRLLGGRARSKALFRPGAQAAAGHAAKHRAHSASVSHPARTDSGTVPLPVPRGVLPMVMRWIDPLQTGPGRKEITERVRVDGRFLKMVPPGDPAVSLTRLCVVGRQIWGGSKVL
jgi:hypothetical protein